MKWSSAFFCLLLLLFGIACTMDTQESFFKLDGDVLGASGFPRIMGGLLAVLCLIDLIRTLVQKPAAETGENSFNRNIYAALAISAGYVLGISYVGFAISTFLYLIMISLTFVDFDFSKIRGILVYSLGVTAVAFFFFKVFKVYLPDTWLF